MPYLSTRRSLAGFVPILIGIRSSLKAETPPNPGAGDVSALFQDARATAAQLERDVIEMENYARSKVSWQTHGVQITAIKNHINKAGQIAAQLEMSRSKAETWHLNAIDRITPLLRELASNTEAMIERINQQKNMTDPAYNAYLKSNEALATELSNLISETVNYDKTKGEMSKNL